VRWRVCRDSRCECRQRRGEEVPLLIGSVCGRGQSRKAPRDGLRVPERRIGTPEIANFRGSWTMNSIAEIRDRLVFEVIVAR
jgi:hypothetical protein